MKGRETRRARTHTTNRGKDRRRTGSQEEDALECWATVEMLARETLTHARHEPREGQERNRITRRRCIGREGDCGDAWTRDTGTHSHHEPWVKDRRRTGSQEDVALEGWETVEMHARETPTHARHEPREGRETHRITRRRHLGSQGDWRCMHVRHWHTQATNRRKDRRRTAAQEGDALEGRETVEMHGLETRAHSHHEPGTPALPEGKRTRREQESKEQESKEWRRGGGQDQEEPISGDGLRHGEQGRARRKQKDGPRARDARHRSEPENHRSCAHGTPATRFFTHVRVPDLGYAIWCRKC